MKKLSIILFALLMLALPVLSWSAGSCTQATAVPYRWGDLKITLICTGDSDNGSIPTQTISNDNMGLILGTHWLYSVKAYPTPGGTAPDAADVAVLMDGQDLLGTKGANLIHATATQDVFPYSAFMSSWRYVPVTNTITLTVANQGTASANYTIELYFSR